MIIQIRGTSGSGKSTAMRHVLDGLEWQAEYRPGRKKPLYYRSLNAPCRVVVLGHYDSLYGGCDTIGSARVVYELTQELVGRFDVVLQEGLLLSEDVKWTTQMKDVRAIFLVTPLVQCLNWITERRGKVGNDKPLNPQNTTNRVKTIERARVKLTEAGVDVRRASADQTPRIIQNWIQQCKTKQPG